MLSEDDLRIDTHTNGAGEWQLRVMNTRTGKCASRSGRGHVALWRAKREASREAMNEQHTLSEQDLQAIEARANAATEGPWTARETLNWGEPGTGYACVVDANENEVLGDESCDTLLEDARFSAHARTDIPKLVTEVRRLRKELGNCEQTREWMKNAFYEASACQARLIDVVGEACEMTNASQRLRCPKCGHTWRASIREWRAHLRRHPRGRKSMTSRMNPWRRGR